MNKQDWNTYDTRGYQGGRVDHQPSSGGVHLHQVRCVEPGTIWQIRIMQSNGTHQASGSLDVVLESMGEKLFAMAKEN
tara:strand:+ start:805 stop:1038 length:234 start_codon:yes stop_codon:yes gene_type:complete